MLVGDVLVKMSADVADLRSGFEQMKSQADKFGQGVTDGISKAKEALIGLAAGLSVGMFVNAIRESIEYADKLNDLSQKTGIAVETLGGLGYAAEQSGVNLDQVVGASVKLAKSMEDAATGGKETSAVFKALGVDVVDASGNLRSIDETMFDVADQFAQMEDGAGKTALAVKLFGKSGADMIPMLNQGGDALRAATAEYAKYGGVTQETASRADQFNDTLAKLNLMNGALVKEITAAVLPTLQAIADIFVDAKSKGEGFKGAAENINTALKFVVSAGIYAVETITTLAKGLGALAAMVVAVLNGDFKTAVGIAKEYGNDVSKDWAAASDKVDKVWAASAANIVKTSQDAGPKTSAPLVKAADDSAKEFKNLEDEFKLIQAADAAGLAPNTVKQLGDLMTLLDAGKISRDDYDRWLGLVLDKDPKLAAEQKEINKAYDDMAKWLAKVNDERVKELDKLDDEISKQRESNATFGLGKVALADYNIQQLEVLRATVSMGEYSAEEVAQLDAKIEKWKQLKKELELGDTLVKQKKDLDDSKKYWADTFKTIDDSARATFTGLFSGTFEGWKSMWESMKTTALNVLYELAVRPLVIQIVASLSGITGMEGLANAATGAGGSGGGIFGDLLKNIPGIATGFGDIAFAAADFAQLLGQGVGVLDAFSMATSAAGLTLSSAIPVVGAVVAAGTLIYNWLDSKKGGPKEGGFATSGETPGIGGVDSTGRWMTPSGSDSQMLAAVNQMTQQYNALLEVLGGTGSAVFAQGFSTDPKGTAPSNVHTGTWVNGVQVFDNPNGNVGRSPEELKAELETQAARAILAALQASALPTVVADYLASIDVSTATVEQIKAALAHAAELKDLVDAVSALPEEMAEGLLAALGVDPELDAKIKAFAEGFAAFSKAAGELQDQLDRDPQAEALKQLALAHVTTFEKVGILKGGLEDALAAYDGSTEGTKNLTAATKAYVDAQVAALIQIQNIRDGLTTLFGETTRAMELALMSTEEKQKFYLNEALATMDLLKSATDPAEIDRLSRIINQDLTAAFNLMSPEEQKAQHDYLKGILDDAQTIANTQLDLAHDAVVDAGTQSQTILTEVQNALDAAAEKQMDAAQALIDAAQAIKDAASQSVTAAETNVAAANTNAAAASTNAAAATVNLEAAQIPITVNVETVSGP